MVADKKKRKDLVVPGFVKERWEAGGNSKDMMAMILMRANFEKVIFSLGFLILTNRSANPCHILPSLLPRLAGQVPDGVGGGNQEGEND